MPYVWDRKKAGGNIKKHGVDFTDAALVLEDPLGLARSDPDAEREERFVPLGEDSGGELLVVVWSLRGEDIRLISARRATATERRQYEER